VFSQSSTFLEQVSVGDIIVSGTTPKAPHGFLRKVVSKSQEENKIIIQTTQAKLTEAIQQGSVLVSRSLTPADTTSFTIEKGLIVHQVPDDGFNLTINTILFDGDGNRNTTNDQIRASGSISFNLTFNFEYAIKNHNVESLVFKVSAIESKSLTVSTEVQFLNASKKFPIARWKFKPIVIFIGYVPIVITPTITLYLGLDGNLSLSMEAGYDARNSYGGFILSKWAMEQN